MAACTPIVRWWGRLEVSGLEHLPAILDGIERAVIDDGSFVHGE